MSKVLQIDLANIADYIHKFDFNNKKIFVTGSTGLIGSLVIKAFVEYSIRYSINVKVIALARNKEKIEEVYPDQNMRDRIIWICQDVESKIVTDIPIDYIVHAASVTTSKTFTTNPVETIRTTIMGTCNIMELAREKRVSGVVYVSSMEVYGIVKKGSERTREEDLGHIDILSVRSSYSEGKRMAECICHAYANEYNVPVKIARLAQTFGPGVALSDNRVFMQFAKSVMNGSDIVLHTLGMSYGNYCYTTDAIKALILLLCDGSIGQAYNVVNEQSAMRICDVAQLVSDVIGAGKTKVIYDIADSKSHGYAPDTELKLSADKLKALGWEAEVGLDTAFSRLIMYIKDLQ